MPFRSSKEYTSERGYAVAYRQWRAESHCNKIHGYALGFRVVFECEELGHANWCVDFGSLKSFKDFLDDHFDHTCLVAQDDPEFATFEELHRKHLIKMVVVDMTGCEGLSKFLYDYINEIWLVDNGYKNAGVRCVEVEVRETPSNSACYVGDGT